jgi:hypothetical protein
MESKVKETACCSESPAAQRESVRSAHSDTSNHSNPTEIRPVGDKAATGGKFN